MNISTEKIDVLRALAHEESDRGLAVSVDRVCAAVNDGPNSCHPSSDDIMFTLRKLHQMHFVTFDTGDSIVSPKPVWQR